MSVFCQWGSQPRHKTFYERQVLSFLSTETNFSRFNLEHNENIVQHLFIQLYLLMSNEEWHGLVPRYPQISGSVPENLKVVEPNEFDIIFPFSLGSLSSVWSVTHPSRQNEDICPKFQPYVISNDQPDRKDQKVLPYYGISRNGTFEISPVKFYQHVKNIMLKCLKRIPTEELNYEYSLQGNSDNSPAVTIKIHDLSNDRHILVDLVPALDVVHKREEVERIEKGWFSDTTVKSYRGHSVLMVAKGKDDSWRRSYSREEHYWSHECKDTLYDVLKVIKTLAYKKAMTPLKNFDSYVYKNALFNFAESYYRFKVDIQLDDLLEDFIRYLINCFRTGTVRRHFEKGTNLLATIDATKIASVADYLTSFLDDLYRGLKLNRMKEPSTTSYELDLEKAFEAFHKSDVLQNTRHCQLVAKVAQVEKVVKRLLETHFEQKNFRQRFKVGFSRAQLRSKYPDKAFAPPFCQDVLFHLNYNYPSVDVSFDLNCAAVTWRILPVVTFQGQGQGQGHDQQGHGLDSACLIGPPRETETTSPSTSWFPNLDLEFKRSFDLDQYDNGCRAKVFETLLLALSSTLLKVIDKDVLLYLAYLRRHDYRWCLKPNFMARQILDDLSELFSKGTWDQYMKKFDDLNLDLRIPADSHPFLSLSAENRENAVNYLKSFDGSYDLLFYRKYHHL